MNLEWKLPRAYANAYPYHPDFFKELREAIVRTAYHDTFAPLLPAHLAPKFREHVATESLRSLSYGLISHLVNYPHRGHR